MPAHRNDTPSDLFFDLDGTIADPTPGIVSSLAFALAQAGAPECGAGRLTSSVGRPIPATLRDLLGTDDEAVITQASGHYAMHFATQGMLKSSPYPGIEEALTTLAERGFRLHVLSGFPAAMVATLVRSWSFAEHVSGVFGREGRQPPQRHEARLRGALGEVDVTPERAIAVGDRGHDLLAAKACGVAGVGVLWGFGSLQELADADPARMVIEVADLADAMSELSRALVTAGR